LMFSKSTTGVPILATVCPCEVSIASANGLPRPPHAIAGQPLPTLSMKGPSAR
jgi:hypothetical protein